jgi:hypothetical protein
MHGTINTPSAAPLRANGILLSKPNQDLLNGENSPFSVFPLGFNYINELIDIIQFPLIGSFDSGSSYN